MIWPPGTNNNIYVAGDAATTAAADAAPTAADQENNPLREVKQDNDKEFDQLNSCNTSDRTATDLT